MNNYSNACTEVYAIINDLAEEDYKKIPPEVIMAIKNNRNLDYIFALDYDIDLKDNILLKETRAILFNLYRDYLAAPEQKEKIVKMQNEERQKLEVKKQKMYDANNIFDNSNKQEEAIDNINKTTGLTEVKKDSFINRLINKIKRLFKK